MYMAACIYVFLTQLWDIVIEYASLCLSITISLLPNFASFLSSPYLEELEGERDHPFPPNF